ncbi:hypothetical protein [Virgibacillus doumboii]|uniref:hypothetical protein n=1 Tax=Virgibacillus doumboii TaxID=2697503 RepID=UPI0013E004CC|nr:hypothetical protein [Virgibacillus doumboii]
MYTVKVINERKKIAMLKWEGMVKESEVKEATRELDAVYKQFGSQKFYLMVDVKDMKVFSPDAKVAIGEQQKWIRSKIHKVGGVMDKKLIERQLEEVSKESKVDELEVPFPSYEKALEFLDDLASNKSEV